MLSHVNTVLTANIQRFALTIVLVVLLACSSKLTQAATLAGYWSFDENTGITANDTSGNGHTGTLMSNATLPSWTSGRSGDADDYAIDFLGGTANTGPHVNLGNPVGLQLTGSRSYSLWLRPTALPTSRYAPLGKSYSGIGTLNVNSPGTFTQYYGGTATTPNTGSHATQTSIAAASAGTWIHVVHTRDSGGSTQRFYLDGVAQPAAAWSTYNPTDLSTGSWLIGNGYTGAFNGVIDDPALWDGALTPAEVASVYQLDAQSGNALRAMGMNIPELDELWDIYNGGLGNSGIVDGKTWTHVDGISAGSNTLGQAWTVGNVLDGFQTYLLLDTGTNAGLLMETAGIPEPSSFLLLGLGALGLARHTRRRRQSGC